MNKRITSLLLCFVMVFAMLATAVPVFAADTVKITMTSDKTKASPGDIITYTVALGKVSRFDSMRFELSIPAGLSFVAGSGKLTDGLKETLNCVDTAWTESTKVFYITQCSDGTGYTSENSTELMEFQCKVDDGATGNLKIEFIMVPNDCYDSDYENFDVTRETPTVTVTAPTKPATGIKLNKDKTTIYTGNTETLVATVTPTDTTDTVTWTSSDSTVATVNQNGIVTAKKVGTATITAKAGSKSATCVVTVENAPCTHTNKTDVAEKASTCKERGWDAYKQCDDCGQLFDTNGKQIGAIPYRDLAEHTGGTATCQKKAVCSVCHEEYGKTNPNNHAGSTEYEQTATSHTEKYTCCNAIKTPAAAHNWENGKCTVCAYQCQHKETEVKNAKAATCTEAGYTGDTYCKNCGIKTKAGSTIAATGHTMTKTEAKAPTCAEAGNIEYWTCSKPCCKDKHFDKDGKEITTAVTIPALTHELIKTEAKAATCTEAGNIEYWTCSKTCCKDKYFDKDGKEITTVIVAATGHTMTKTEAKAATCTQDGTNAYWTCSACNKVFADAAGKTETSVEKEKLTKLGHDESKAYTYDATGHWKFCTRCGEVIGKAGHIWNKDTPAEGEAQFCTTCGYVKQAAKTPCEKHADGVFTCDANGHYRICKACGAEYDREKHSFQETTVNGKKFHSCTECGYTEEIKTVTPTTPSGNNSNAKNPYTKNDGKKVQSGKTFDAGIALYVGLSVLSVTGGALVIGKKKEL